MSTNSQPIDTYISSIPSQSKKRLHTYHSGGSNKRRKAPESIHKERLRLQNSETFGNPTRSESSTVDSATPEQSPDTLQTPQPSPDTTQSPKQSPEASQRRKQTGQSRRSREASRSPVRRQGDFLDHRSGFRTPSPLDRQLVERFWEREVLEAEIATTPPKAKIPRDTSQAQSVGAQRKMPIHFDDARVEERDDMLDEIGEDEMPPLTRHPSRWSGIVTDDHRRTPPDKADIQGNITGNPFLVGHTTLSSPSWPHVPRIHLHPSISDEQRRLSNFDDPPLYESLSHDSLERLDGTTRHSNRDISPFSFDIGSLADIGVGDFEEPEDPVAEIHLPEQMDGAVSDDSVSTLKPQQTISLSSLDSTGNDHQTIRLGGWPDSKPAKLSSFTLFTSLEDDIQKRVIEYAVQGRLYDVNDWTIQPNFYAGSLHDSSLDSCLKHNFDSGIMIVDKAWSIVAAEALYSQHEFLFEDPRVLRWWLKQIGSNVNRLRRLDLLLKTGKVNDIKDCETSLDMLWCKTLAPWKSSLHLSVLRVDFRPWNAFRWVNDDKTWPLVGRWREELLVLLMSWRDLELAEVSSGYFHWGTRKGINWQSQIWLFLQDFMVLESGKHYPVEKYLRTLVKEDQARRGLGSGKSIRF